MKTKIGRPPYNPTDADKLKVERMAAMGMPQYEIAKIMGISDRTLRRRHKKELAEAAPKANLRVVETLYEMATSGKNAAAAIFWAKTRCGFTTNVTEAAAEEAKTESRLVIMNQKGERVA